MYNYSNMTTDRDLRNQLVYAIETNDYDALAGVVADMINKAHCRGVEYGMKIKAEKIAQKMFSTGISREEVAALTGVNIDER